VGIQADDSVQIERFRATQSSREQRFNYGQILCGVLILKGDTNKTNEILLTGFVYE